MGRREIRLSSVISFDEEKEADIIEKVDALLDSRNFGGVVSNLIRVYFDCPSKLESQKELVKALSDIDKLGVTNDRYKFFKEVSKAIKYMENKIDAIYDMNLKLLTLAQFGKHIGIEQKTDNMLRAQFVLEKQLEDLSNTLGIDHINHVFNSNKLLDSHEKSKEILEYIIETYDGVVKEISKDAIIGMGMGVGLGLGEKMEQSPQEVLGEPVGKQETKDDDHNINEIKDSKDTEEYIDFGDADINALNSFFGE